MSQVQILNVALTQYFSQGKSIARSRFTWRVVSAQLHAQMLKINFTSSEDSCQCECLDLTNHPVIITDSKAVAIYKEIKAS